MNIQSPIKARRRLMRVRRLPAGERRALGLQPGVGYTDEDLARARYYRALEMVIARETREQAARLAPLAKIGFDGRAPFIEAVPHPDNPRAAIERVINQTPLDYLRFQARSPLDHWEWVTGKRFEYDWHVATYDRRITGNLDFAAIAKPMTAAERRRREALTFRPRSSARAPARPGSVADSRLDAMARLGRLAAEISQVSYWLLEHIVGHEWTLERTARALGVDQRYLGPRFREALTEAAGHYRLGPSARPRRR